MPQQAARTDLRIVAPVAEDFDDWSRLYDGYAVFYKLQPDAARNALVWSWLQDPAHEVCGLFVRDAAGHALGLAHLRPFARPLRARMDGFLDDLFVVPQARGSGVVEALWVAMRALARERGWTTVRWITAEDNYRARTAYDRVATRTGWVTYDMDAGQQ